MAITPDPASNAETPTPTETPALVPGPSAFHESSQFRHWRYSRDQLYNLRHELNEKSREVTERNMKAEREAQASLGADGPSPPPPTTYPSVEEELKLVNFYCDQASKICRQGFGVPEYVESTTISYIKRFYLKNSVMEWHPKNIMPTCLFLAAKTTNHPIPIEVFVPKFKNFKSSDILEIEFVIAQSLAFEFWTHGAERALRGWFLEFQNKPANIDILQRNLPSALDWLSRSRLTDAEFLWSPSQIGLACWRLTAESVVDEFLDEKYANWTPPDGYDDEEEGPLAHPYGIPLPRLRTIIRDIQEVIRSTPPLEQKQIKEIDKRLKNCLNPERVPGTALYIKRKAELEAKAAEAKAVKTAKVKEAMEKDELVFGAAIKPADDDPFGPPPPKKEHA